MKYRIIKETSCAHDGTVEASYRVQHRYPFIPIWFTHSEDMGIYTALAVFGTLKEAEDVIKQLTHKCIKTSTKQDLIKSL